MGTSDERQSTDSSHQKKREPWLAVTLLAALVIVFATERLTPREFGPITPGPLALNILAFAAFTWIVVALTNRTLFAVALVTTLFGLLVLSNYLKIRYLSTPLHPADLFVVSNVVYVHLFPTWVVISGSFVAIAIVVGLLALLRVDRYPATIAGRAAVLVISIALLGGLVGASRSQAATDFLRSRGIASFTPRPSIEMDFNGLLLGLLLRVGDLFVPVPEGYDEAAIRRVLSSLEAAPRVEGANASGGNVNLILFVVEAMMDPDDLGWRFTSDPMPFVRDLRQRFSSGWAYSPEAGGRSANPEFELLSGLATYYLPPESVAYMGLVTRPLPALPRFFVERGYHASALHVDTLAFYNYVEVYRDFGFSDARTLRFEKDVELDASGRVPSDAALVKRVIEVSRERQPYFLFAFTNATHLPYDYPAFLKSDLDIVEPLSPPVRGELKTYINALRAADQAIEKLVRHFEGANDRVVIAILGDHLPGLSAEAFSRSKMLGVKTFADGMAMSHRCPIVLWSNFPVQKRDFELSLNFVGQRVLEEMGIVPTGPWGANAAMAARYPVISKFIQAGDGRRFPPEELPAADAERIRDYGLLQYDLLFGEQYSRR